MVEYEVVGAIESDVGQGRLSVEAPVGRALLGAVAGDVVTVACPGGELRFEVMGVTAAERRPGGRARRRARRALAGTMLSPNSSGLPERQVASPSASAEAQA